MAISNDEELQAHFLRLLANLVRRHKAKPDDYGTAMKREGITIG